MLEVVINKWPEARFHQLLFRLRVLEQSEDRANEDFQPMVRNEFYLESVELLKRVKRVFNLLEKQDDRTKSK